jgi:hypothetical protein
MSYREDYLRMLDGKTPVSDVMYNRFMGGGDEAPGIVMVMSSATGGFGNFDDQGRNLWGVPYKEDVFGTGFMPAPGQFILTDATKWKDVIKAPYREIDWEAAAEADLANLKYDPETQLTSMFGAGGGYFLQLSGFMGFEGTMLAMYDEPDALHELLDYLCDYDCWMLDNLLKHYPVVEIMGMGDDNATEINPFVSLAMFREFLLPRYKRIADKLVNAGKIISYHNCGRCEDFMDDMVDIGVRVWNSATPVNDLNGFKAKHDNKFIMEVTPRFYLESTEVEIRQQVRDTIDTYAPGGSFIFAGGTATMNQELAGDTDNWIYDEVKKYGKGFYS